MPLGLSDNLFKRIISALSLLPIVLGAIYLGHWWFFGLLAIGGYLMVAEWLAMHGQKGTLLALICTLLSSIIPIIFLLDLNTIVKTSHILIGSLVCAAIILLIVSPARLASARSRDAGFSILPIMAGVAYVGMALISLMWLRGLDHNGKIVIWLFFAVWAMDVGGYFAGKGIGGPKLAPKLSPKKTWAGLIGGMVLAAIISAIISQLFDIQTPLLLAIAGAVIAAIAQAGDLYESSIKRHMNIKDSGALIPGHGGILDRVDGLIFAAPFAAVIIVVNSMTNAG